MASPHSPPPPPAAISAPSEGSRRIPAGVSYTLHICPLPNHSALSLTPVFWPTCTQHVTNTGVYVTFEFSLWCQMYSIYHVLSVEQTGAKRGIHNSLSGRRVSVTGAAGMKSIPNPAVVLCRALPGFGQLPLAGTEAAAFPGRLSPSISFWRLCRVLEGLPALVCCA